MSSFIEFSNQLKERSPCKAQLISFFSLHPEHIKIEQVNGVPELWFDRRMLLKALRKSQNEINLRSFERALKRENLVVVASTHEGKRWKKWRFKNTLDKEGNTGEERSKKRARENFDYKLLVEYEWQREAQNVEESLHLSEAVMQDFWPWTLTMSFDDVLDFENTNDVAIM